MSDGGEDQEAHKHPHGPGYERLATTVVLDQIQTDEGDTEVDTVEDHLCHVAVVDAHATENGGTIVEKVVGAGQLLEHLQDDAEQEAIGHTRGAEHGDILANGPVLDLIVGLELGFDLLEFGVHGIVVGRGTENTDHRLAGLVDAAATVVVSRRFGEEEDSDTQNCGKNPADADDDAP